MSYDPRVVQEIRSIAQRRYASDPKRLRRYLLTAFTTGIVESGLQNLRGGDADSAGWRQERASLYKDPTNLSASINRFFNELEQHDRGQTVGELAADVQRPAAQFRGRYAQHLGEARRLAGGTAPAVGGTAATRGHLVPGQAPRLIPGSPETVDHKAAMLAAVTDPRKNMSLLQRFNQAVQSGSYTTPATPAQVVSGKGPRFVDGAGGGSVAGGLVARANAIDAQHLPYKLGGGHGGSTDGPLDCSGAVSKLLGINPRVAADFMKWGKAGRDPSGQLTIYANAGHVLVEIGGHFWGTSRTNPGGGAGWIPRSAISPQYLSRFVARHM